MAVEELAPTEIGAFEAKTKLSEILRRVDQGERFTITVRGRAVAEVVPSGLKQRLRAEEAVRRLQAIKKIEGISHEMIRSWIEEGRP